MTSRRGVTKKESAINVESTTFTARGSSCFGDCEIKKYTYGEATNILQKKGGGTVEKLKPNTQQEAGIKEKINGLTKQTYSACAGTGCVCVEAAKQPQGYPKRSKPRTKTLTISDPGGEISFEVTRTFEIYAGYCDEDDFV